MKTRNTLILFVLAAGLFAFIYFYESKLPSTAERAALEKTVVKVDREKLTGITLVNNEEKIVLQKADGKWQLVAPVKDRADESAVSQLISAVEVLRRDATLEGGSGNGKVDIKDVGLAKPNVRLKLESGGSATEILFGKDTATEGKQYLRLEGSNTIYVVNNDLKTQVAKKADEFRDHRLTELNASQINKVLIKSPGGEIELQKDRDHWQLNKPLKARGDDAKIADQIAQTLNTRIDSFVSGEVSTAAAAAIAEPSGTVTIYAEGSEKPTVVQISKESEKDQEKVYAKLSTRDAILLLPKPVGDILNLKPNDLRDKSLARFSLDIVDRIHIAPAGKPEITLLRQEEEWMLKGPPARGANGGEVQQMASALQSQQVAAFVSDVATELPKYGLDQPQLSLTFSSYASENTAESAAGENAIVSILFGKVEGENVFAKLDDEPFIVAVPRSVLDRIHPDALLWQELAIFKLKPEDVNALEVTRGDATVSLTKDKKGWKPTKGDAQIDTANVQSLLNTLTSLRAVRWVGEEKSEHGLAKAALTVVFTTSDKKTHQLRLGAPTPDGMYFARSDAEGVFVVNKPDFSAFEAPLTQGAQAQPSPSAVSSPQGSASPAK